MLDSVSAQWVSVVSDADSLGQHIRNFEPALSYYAWARSHQSGSAQAEQLLSNDSIIQWWAIAIEHFKNADKNKPTVAMQLQGFVDNNPLDVVMPLCLQRMIKAAAASHGFFASGNKVAGSEVRAAAPAPMLRA